LSICVSGRRSCESGAPFGACEDQDFISRRRRRQQDLVVFGIDGDLACRTDTLDAGLRALDDSNRRSLRWARANVRIAASAGSDDDLVVDGIKGQIVHRPASSDF